MVRHEGFENEIRNRTGRDFVNDVMTVCCVRCGAVIHSAALYDRLEEKMATDSTIVRQVVRANDDGSIDAK